MPYSMPDSERNFFTGFTVIFSNWFENECGCVPTTAEDAIWYGDTLLAGRFSTGCDQGEVRCVSAKQRADGWGIKFIIPEEQLQLAERSMCKKTGKLQWKLLSCNQTFTKWVENHRVDPKEGYTSTPPPPRPLLSAYF